MTASQDEKDLLSRLDERTENIQKWMAALDKKIESLASSHVRLDLFTSEVDSIKKNASKQDGEIRTLKNQISAAAVSILVMLIAFILQVLKA